MNPLRRFVTAWGMVPGVLPFLALALCITAQAAPITFPHQLVSAAAFSPDGKQVLTGGWDNTAKLWRLDGSLVATFAHGNSVYAVAFSPDGKQVLIGSGDNTAKLWQLDGSPVATFPHDDRVKAVAFSPDGKQVLTGSFDDAAKLWKLDGSLVAYFNDPDRVSALAFSPDSKLVLIGGYSNTAKLWKLDGSLVAAFPHSNIVDSVVDAVAFSPDGKQVLTGGSDVTAKLWRLDGSLVTTFAHDSAVESIAFSPDGNQVLTGSSDGTAKLWRQDGSLVAIIADASYPNAVAFSPDGKQMLIGGHDGARLVATTAAPFQASGSANSAALTINEVGTMARLGVKVRYENKDGKDEKDEGLHPLSAGDLPKDVVTAVELDMHGIYLDQLPAWLAKFRNVRYLNLSGNQLTFDALAPLQAMSELEQLDLSNNPLFTVYFTGRSFFQAFPNLRVLKLDSTRLTDPVLDDIRKAPGLEELSLSGNRLSSPNFDGMKSLKVLEAKSSRIIDLPSLRTTELKRLDVSNNWMSRLDVSMLPDSIEQVDASNNSYLTVLQFDRNADKGMLELLKLTGNKDLKLPESLNYPFVLQNLRVLEVDSSVSVPEGLRRKLSSWKN